MKVKNVFLTSGIKVTKTLFTDPLTVPLIKNKRHK